MSALFLLFFFSLKAYTYAKGRALLLPSLLLLFDMYSHFLAPMMLAHKDTRFFRS